MKQETAAFPKLIALSGPLEGQSFKVDEKGVRVSEDCIVRLRDGRAVAFSVRDGQDKPWRLLDHKARLDGGGSEFTVNHEEFDPDTVLGLFPDFPNEEIESFFLGLLMENIARPVAAAVLLDQWNPGERAFATFLPGFFYPRYNIVNETRRQIVPGIYDEAEQVFCARLSHENQYIGALYVKSLTPAPFRPEERTEITRLAGYLAIHLHNRDDWDRAPKNRPEPEETEEDVERRVYRISSPADLEVVFEEMPPAYRFGHKEEQPVIEEVPTTLENLLDKLLGRVFYDIDAVIGAAALLEIPQRPLHFIRVQNPQDFEIDKDVVYRAFTLGVDAARNSDGAVWAVPITRHDEPIGVLYVQLEKKVEMDPDLIEEVQLLADVSNHSEFPQNLDRFF